MVSVVAAQSAGRNLYCPGDRVLRIDRYYGKVCRSEYSPSANGDFSLRRRIYFIGPIIYPDRARKTQNEKAQATSVSCHYSVNRPGRDFLRGNTPKPCRCHSDDIYATTFSNNSRYLCTKGIRGIAEMGCHYCRIFRRHNYDAPVRGRN